MKATSLLVLCALLLATQQLAAQTGKTSIYLKNGILSASENISGTTADRFNAQLAKSGKIIGLLQFEQLPGESTRKALRAAGIELLSYIPQNAYTIAVSAPVQLAVLRNAKVRMLMPLSPSQKIAAELLQPSPTSRTKQSSRIVVRISLPKSLSPVSIAEQLKGQGFELVSTKMQRFHLLDIRLPEDRLTELAASPLIEFVQPLPPPDQALNLNSRSGSKANSLNASVANGGKGLLGEGVVIGVGDNANIQGNIDFSGRILSSGVNDLAAHGVHVSGTATGAGIINESARGYAPRAKIVSEYFSNVLFRSSKYIQDHNMVLTNNSYGNYIGCGTYGVYESSANAVDQMAFDYPNLLNVFASGNSGNAGCFPFPTGFHNVLGGYQSSKNALIVGNTTDSGLIYHASSKGPVQDGRIKPEVTAMGTQVYSNGLFNSYYTNTGTSMASPAVTGGSALLYQRYRQLNGHADPASALVKALICNGATDRGTKGPDFSYGFGWMNLSRSVDMLEQGRYFSGTSTNGSVSLNNIVVPPNTAQLKVMLYWHDPAASPASARALVNDLDLEVITPSSALHLPQVLDTSSAGLTLPSVMGADHLNNIEQVVIDNPADGSYSIRVRGTSIAENPDQPFYIVYDFVPVGLKITAPAGGEAWAPTGPGTGLSKISWEADGFSSGTVSLDYSLDGGTSWQGIVSGLAINRKVFSWWVPAHASGQALVRITKDGTGETNTSAPFTIAGIPVVVLNPVQCPTYIGLTWRTVPGITDYEVMRLSGSEMVSVGYTTDTSYLISGLSRDSVYWVSVRARVNGSAGNRYLALARQPSDGSCSGTGSDNDLELAAVLSPVSGRFNTSSALTATSPVTVEVRNLDDAQVNGFSLRYSLNEGPWITEHLPSQSIAAGGSYTHTFSSPVNLLATGTYKLAVEVINDVADGVMANNIRYATIRHLNNDPLVLGFFDDLETADARTYGFDTLGLAGVERYDFSNTTPTGQVVTGRGTGEAYSGLRAFNSESTRPLTSGPYSSNDITGTFNLGAYSTASSDLRLDFRYLFSGTEGSPSDKVWVRGDDAKPWVEAYAYQSTADEYRLTPSIELSDLLTASGQNFSSSFQVRWTHVADRPTIHRDINFSIDDIRLYEVMNDVQMLSIDTPLMLNCGLGPNVPLKVTVRNSHDGTRTNIPVKYSVNGGPWIREVIATISGNTTIQYTFANGPDLSGIGLYTIKAIVDDSSDSFHANDTAVNEVHNAPLITSFPYLQNFEAGDGGFHAGGDHTSWEFGTPASQKIGGAASGTNAWKTRLSGTYNDNEHSFLYSPCFNLSGMTNPTLSFSAAMDLEDCGGTFCDGVQVEYSTDGTTWARLDTATGGRNRNWYNKTDGFWSVENRTRWHVVTCALPNNLSQVRFRFVMQSDQGVTREGIAVDDFHVYDNQHGIYEGGGSGPVTGVVAGTDWVNFQSGGKLVASIHPQSQNLGSTDVTAFIHPGPVRWTSTQYYHNRNITIKPAIANPADSVSVRFYFLDTETDALVNATGCSGCSKPEHAFDLGISKYSDPNSNQENGTISDNTTGRWTFILPSNVTKVPFDKGYYAEFKIKEFSEFWLNSGGLNSNTALPVRILKFTAARRGTGAVDLMWTAENEQNIEHYEIEMAEGNAGLQANRFVKVGSVTATTAEAMSKTYNFLHGLPSTSPIRYYRLKIIERDGTARYSEIRSVMFTEEVGWKIFPNPSNGIYQLLFQVENSVQVEASIFDSKGLLVRRFSQRGTGFLQKAIINLEEASLPSGTYLLQVSAGSKKLSFKLYKQ